LRSVDVWVVLVTLNSATSKWMSTEIEAVRAYQETLPGDILFLPAVVGQVNLPAALNDVPTIQVTGDDVTLIGDRVRAAIAQFTGRQAANQVTRQDIQYRLEQNAADYVDPTLQLLHARETHYRQVALFWYTVGLVALIGGIAASLLISRAAIDRLGAPGEQWTLFAFVALKNLIIIGLLIAAAKYAFSLGKSYMNESLKNSDRSHAISFGKFYLRAFGDKASLSDIKEVFQHWNIAKEPSFAAIDTKEFDPDFMGAVVRVANVIAARDAKSP
jgi:hypothetical protein